MRNGLLAPALSACFMFTACGGGGGDSAPATTPTSPTPLSTTNVAAAVKALMRTPHSYSLSGSTSTGVNLTATLGIAQGGTLTHQGLSFDSSVLTITLFRGGTLLSASVSTLWYYPGTVNLRFSTNSGDSTCNNYTAISNLPVAANLGQSGSYFVATQYPGCTSPNNAGPMSSGTVTGTWSYSDIGGIAFVCLNSSNKTNGLVSTSTESDCVEVVDTNGTLGTRARIALKDPNGVTTVLSN